MTRLRSPATRRPGWPAGTPASIPPRYERRTNAPLLGCPIVLSGARRVPCREAFLCVLQAGLSALPSSREAGPHRLLGLELRRVARARLSPRACRSAAGSSTTRPSSTRSRSTRPSTGCRSARRSSTGSRWRPRGSSSRSRRAATSPTSSACARCRSTCRGCSSSSSRCSARRRWARCCGSFRRASTATTIAWPRRCRHSGRAATRSSSATRAGSAAGARAAARARRRAGVRRPSGAAVSVVEPTADWIYVRLHHGARGRRGNYSRGRARDLAPPDRRLARRREVYLYANNDWEGFSAATRLATAPPWP